MSITVTFDPPLPSDSPSVFNTKAFTLLGDLNDWSTEANALASTVSSNASTSATNASNASSSASAAATSASNASTSAGNASSSASAASSSASSASSSASAASTSASNASTSASAAAASAASINPSLLPSMRPTLLLDFANSKSVDPRITFTRASTAIRTNANGLLESVASGVPRIDYDPVTLACKGLLIEESRTNLLTYSEQFDNAAWTKASATVTANAVTAPDGATTADKMVESTATAIHYVYQSQTVSTSTAYTLTVYAKAGERSKFDLILEDTGASGANFDLINGTIGAPHNAGASNASSAATISNVGNGWYRCSLTRTTVSSPLCASFRPSNGSTATYTGDGTSGLYLFGAQLEAGAFATSYVSTTSAQVTRAADIATMTGSNFSSWYRQDEGTFVACGSVSRLGGSGFPAFASVDDTGSSNAMELAVWDGASDQTQFAGYVANVAQWAVSGAVYASGSSVTIAGAYKTNDFQSAVSGVLGTADVSGAVPTVTQLSVGGNRGGGGPTNGHIARLAYYPKRLTNAELQALSA